ncbi:LPXTG cell wall anchor domain-containing protein [Actinokineospora sp. 24-640]
MSGRIAAIALFLLVGAAPVAVADDGPAPAGAAAGWLARQLTGGDHMETVFDGTAYPDHGLTADVVLALDAGGAAQDHAAAATEWLAGNAAAYLGDGTTEAYAGAHAKLALVAQAQGEDPAAFAGVDLIARLTALRAPSGRFTDKSAYGDFSNGITQSLAVLALHRSGGAPATAVDYLAGSACPDGGFPLYLEKAPCASDVDTTGYAVQALVAVGREPAAALDWLAGKQQANGGFPGSGPTPGVNANSTGLAATALAAGGRAASADKAVAYLLGRQVGCTGVAADRGAIAYDASGFAAATAARATSQAIAGITGVSLDKVSADGASATAPVLACAAPPVTTTVTTAPPATTSTTATTATTVAPTTTAAPTTTTTAPIADTDDLANTGVEVGPAVGVGGLLVLGGAGLLLLGRRRRLS